MNPLHVPVGAYEVLGVSSLIFPPTQRVVGTVVPILEMSKSIFRVRELALMEVSWRVGGRGNTPRHVFLAKSLSSVHWPLYNWSSHLQWWDYCHTCFTDEETKVQRGCLTHLGSTAGKQRN